MAELKYNVEEIENEFEFVDNLNESLWITPTGELLTGDYDMGVRGTDHRALLDFYDLDRDDSSSWDNLHEVGFVRIVPETKIALIYENQVITDEQKYIVETNDYSFENYGVLENDNTKEEKQLETLDNTFIDFLKKEVSEDYYQGMKHITEDNQSPYFNSNERNQREQLLDNIHTISNFLDSKNIKTTLNTKNDTLNSEDNKVSINFKDINKEPEKAIQSFESNELSKNKSIEIEM